jgi:hypothetical protein
MTATISEPQTNNDLMILFGLNLGLLLCDQGSTAIRPKPRGQRYNGSIRQNSPVELYSLSNCSGYGCYLAVTAITWKE